MIKKKWTLLILLGLVAMTEAKSNSSKYDFYHQYRVWKGSENSVKIQLAKNSSKKRKKRGRYS